MALSVTRKADRELMAQEVTKRLSRGGFLVTRKDRPDERCIHLDPVGIVRVVMVRGFTVLIPNTHVEDCQCVTCILDQPPPKTGK